MVMFYGFYHGKSPLNHHLGEFFLLFPSILSKSKSFDDLNRVSILGLGTHVWHTVMHLKHLKGWTGAFDGRLATCVPTKKNMTGWWFQIFSYFHPYFGKMNPSWLICFKGVETTNQMIFESWFSSRGCQSTQLEYDEGRGFWTGGKIPPGN